MSYSGSSWQSSALPPPAWRSAEISAGTSVESSAESSAKVSASAGISEIE